MRKGWGFAVGVVLLLAVVVGAVLYLQNLSRWEPGPDHLLRVSGTEVWLDQFRNGAPITFQPGEAPLYLKALGPRSFRLRRIDPGIKVEHYLIRLTPDYQGEVLEATQQTIPRPLKDPDIYYTLEATLAGGTWVFEVDPHSTWGTLPTAEVSSSAMFTVTRRAIYSREELFGLQFDRFLAQVLFLVGGGLIVIFVVPMFLTEVGVLLVNFFEWLHRPGASPTPESEG